MQPGNPLVSSLLWGIVFWILSVPGVGTEPDSGKPVLYQAMTLAGFLILSLICCLLFVSGPLHWLLLGSLGLLLCFLFRKKDLTRWAVCLRLLLVLISWCSVYNLSFSIFLMAQAGSISGPAASLTGLGFALLLSSMLKGSLSSLSFRSSLFLCLICYGLFAGCCLIRALNPLFSAVESELYYLLCLSEGICIASVCAWGFLAFSADEYGRMSQKIQQHRDALSIQMQTLAEQNRLVHDILNQSLSLYDRLSENTDPVILKDFRELLEALSATQKEEYCSDPQLNAVIQKLHLQFPTVPFSVQIRTGDSLSQEPELAGILSDLLDLLGSSAGSSWNGQGAVLLRLYQTEHCLALLVSGCRLTAEERIHLLKLTESGQSTLTETDHGILVTIPC